MPFTQNVEDVEQLYSAVNDPAYAGATITLAAGRYVLSAADGKGGARPNGGRLELQRDMSLRGVTGDQSAVVIDATGLPKASTELPLPNQPKNRTAPVRIGRGINTIEWLTVFGTPNAAAGVATDLEGTASTQIRVANVISSGTSRGVDVRNAGTANAGRRIDADIVENEFIGPTEETTEVNNGIRLANFPGADGGVVVATLSGNRTHGYQTGCLVGNNRASNATVRARSSGDRFFGNGLGCQVMGGRGDDRGNADSNSTSFEAHGSEFVDNRAESRDRGGILVVGGVSTTFENVASHNTVSVALYGSKVSDNDGVNFQAFGARKDTAGNAGTDNHVTIKLYGVSKQLDVVEPPVDPNDTNTVTVVR